MLESQTPADLNTGREMDVEACNHQPGEPDKIGDIGDLYFNAPEAAVTATISPCKPCMRAAGRVRMAGRGR
jgi:hypothetical protein